MKCEYCGKEVEEDWNFCPFCNNPISSNTKNEKNNIFNKKFTIPPYVYIAIYSVSMILFFIFGDLVFLLVSLVIIIHGKIECRKNLLIKILFYLTIMILILDILFSIWIISACTNPNFYNQFRGCPG